MKGSKHYDYTCRKEIKEGDVKKHLAKGCVVEGTAQEFFDEIEKEAWDLGQINE